MSRVALARLVLPFAVCFLGTAVPAAAQSAATLLAKNGDWEAYTYEEKGVKVCYMATIPKEEADKDRGTAMLSVSHRGKQINVVNAIINTPFKKGSSASLAVGGKEVTLFTNGNGAWARDAATDKDLVQTMIRSNNAVLKGTPANAKAIVQTYSLGGFTASYQAINEACGVK